VAVDNVVDDDVVVDDVDDDVDKVDVSMDCVHEMLEVTTLTNSGCSEEFIDITRSTTSQKKMTASNEVEGFVNDLVSKWCTILKSFCLKIVATIAAENPLEDVNTRKKESRMPIADALPVSRRSHSHGAMGELSTKI